LAFPVEECFSRFPPVAGFGQEGADQAQQGNFFREDAGRAGASFEFHIDPFEWIAGASPALALMGDREGENGEASGQIFLATRRAWERGRYSWTPRVRAAN